jgi:hypothetical protein
MRARFICGRWRTKRRGVAHRVRRAEDGRPAAARQDGRLGRVAYRPAAVYARRVRRARRPTPRAAARSTRKTTTLPASFRQSIAAADTNQADRLRARIRRRPGVRQPHRSEHGRRGTWYIRHRARRAPPDRTGLRVAARTTHGLKSVACAGDRSAKKSARSTVTRRGRVGSSGCGCRKRGAAVAPEPWRRFARCTSACSFSGD